MSHAINDINRITNALISLYAIVDSWCDVRDWSEGRLRQTLHEFLLESRLVLQKIHGAGKSLIDEKVAFATDLQDADMSILRKELRDLLFEYLNILETIDQGGQSDERLSVIESLILSNEQKIKSLEVHL